LEKTQVLGLATATRVGLWEIREQTTLLESVFGYSISGLSLALVGFVRRKLKSIQ